MPLMEPQIDRRIDPARYSQRRPKVTITRLNGKETAVPARLLGLGPTILMLLCPEPLPLDAPAETEIEANTFAGHSTPSVAHRTAGKVFKYGVSEAEHGGHSVIYVRSDAALSNMLLVVDEQSPGRPVVCSVVQPVLMQLMRYGGMSYYLTDERDRTIYLTETETALTGYEQEEILGVNRRFLWRDPKERDLFKDKAIANANNAGSCGPLPIYKCDFKRKPPRDSEMLWLGAASFAILDSDESFMGIHGVYYDITHWIQMDQQSLRAQREYMTTLGHQIKSPLAGIAGYCHMLLQDKTALPRSVANRVETIRVLAGMASRLQSTLVSLSEFLWLPGRPRELKEGHIDLEKRLVLLANEFQGEAMAHNIRIQVDETSLVGIRLKGDERLLEQVFINIIDNAMKYSYPGTTVRIVGQSGKGYFRIEFHNEGIPLSGRDVTRLTEKGFRSDVARAAVPAGTGLGLWLCQQILELHSGLRLEATPTRGGITVFALLVPHERIIRPILPY